jgi:nucleotide-binding universal stress UspA family protein
VTLAIRNILWPTDFSPLSLSAGDAARQVATVTGARLHIVSVAALLVPDSSIVMETAGDVLVSSADVRGPVRRELDQLIRDYFGNDAAVTREALVGVPWREICEYARRASIDLIVISTHGRTGLRHVLLGSVAERVVQHAPCPVLVIKSFELATLG